MSSLLIYSASAGSGKTFTLTRKYLEVILKYPNNYQRTLAVTFTNKAAAEMKERVLSELLNLRDHPEKSDHLEALSKYLNVSDAEISGRASDALHRILNNYSRMAIGTIDSFFQLLFRSFARETGIATGYSLELDSNKVVSQVVDELIRESGRRQRWLVWLQKWIEYRMDQGQGWGGLHKDLVKMGRELLREEILVYALDEDSGFFNQERVDEVIHYTHSVIASFERKLSEFSSSIRESLARNDIDVIEFKGKARSPIAKMVRLTPDSFEPTATMESWANDPQLWVVKSLEPARRSYLITIVKQDLLQILRDYLSFLHSEMSNYFSAKVVNQNVYAFGLAIGFFEMLNKYGEENEIFLMALTNPFLKKIINENPTPFLYEKSGNHYKHFLIDEFQDTSSQQWENLLPLVSNSLSEGGLGMVVGDVKQSIYRWRNSNWRLLASKASQDMAAFGVDYIPLDENFRSGNQIIQFNNDLYSHLPKRVELALADEDSMSTDPTTPFDPRWVSKAYSNITQKPGKEVGEGFVQLQFLGIEEDDYDYKHEASLKLIRLIENLQLEQGYQPNEIAILIRRKKDAILLSGEFTDYQNTTGGLTGVSYQMVSPDTYSLDSSPAVLLLIKLLQFINQPEEPYFEGMFELEFSLRDQQEQPPQYSDLLKVAEELKKEAISWRNLPLSDIVIRSITALGLDQDTLGFPYILALLDMIKEFEMKTGGHLEGWLSWWEETGSSKTVALDPDPTSMQILTIHKAKGLEFPVVILPFVNWSLESTGFDRPILWVPTNDSPFGQIPLIPVPYSSALRKTCFDKDYRKERLEQFIDGINLLYVSTTRPTDQLYLFCPKTDSRKPRISNFLFGLFEDKLDVNHSILLGNRTRLVKKKQDPEKMPQPIEISKLITSTRGFDIKDCGNKDTQAANRGILLHRIFEEMVEIQDYKILLNRYLDKGDIDEADCRDYESILEKVTAIEMVKDWFSGAWQVKKEAELLVPRVGVKRPDRIMIRDDRAIVVDLKTGKRSEHHRDQILEYGSLLKEMGYRTVNGYLLYFQDADLIQVF